MECEPSGYVVQHTERIGVAPVAVSRDGVHAPAAPYRELEGLITRHRTLNDRNSPGLKLGRTGLTWRSE